MKERIKNYLNGVWGAEILIVTILTIVIITTSYQALNSKFAKVGAGPFDALFNEEKYMESMIYLESGYISEKIYNITANLSKLEDILDEDLLDGDNNYYNKNILYIILDKNTGEITTDDFNIYNYIDTRKADSNLLLEEIKLYIENQGFVATIIDNESKFNYYVESNKDKIGDLDVRNYYEIYYRYPGEYRYLLKTESLIAKIIIGTIIVTILLGLKIIINLIFNKKNIHLKIELFSKIIYVLKYGMQYKNTRNKILISFGGAIGVIVVYLYLVAGIRTQNLLVTFLTIYPFKGTLIMVLIPLVCVLYSLKKSLDISIINDGLKKMNSGDLEYNLDNIGDREVKELVNSINKIKDGYKIALNEKVKNEKLKTELISNVSHDLKTPLTSIINYVNILKNSNITEEEQKEYLNILDKKSKRLKTLIEDLFEVSKLNSGKMKINKSEVDIVSLVHQGVGEYSNLYEEKNIEFKVNSNKEETFANLDGRLISRVFENIIINALKYSLENTRVYIDIIEYNDKIRVSFKNISNYEMNFNTEYIFERFARADESRNSSIEGSGMGLAITKSIVELHNGNINIEVEGDMFKIYLELPKK